MDCIVRIECDTCTYDSPDPAKFASCTGCGHTLCIRCLEHTSVTRGLLDRSNAVVVRATGVADNFLHCRDGARYCPDCYMTVPN